MNNEIVAAILSWEDRTPKCCPDLHVWITRSKNICTATLKAIQTYSNLLERKTTREIFFLLSILKKSNGKSATSLRVEHEWDR